MRVILSDVITYCGGVDRALRLAQACLRDAPGPVYSLGQLIHNQEVCSRLEEKGLKVITSPEDVPPGTVVIRAHGVGDDVKRRFLDAGFTLCDATCPIVLHNLERIKELAASHAILVIGEKEHDEVRSMCHVDGAPVTVISSVSDLSSLPKDKSYAVFVQTTFEVSTYETIIRAMGDAGYQFFSANKVCASPIKRRNAVLRLARQCDAIIVVGGKNSANTAMLAHIAASTGKPVWHIENESEVTDQMRGYATVGLASGTSTSLETIRRVQARLLGKDALGAEHEPGKVSQ